MVKYTTAVIVLDRLQNGLTSLSTAEIEEIIEHWESYVDVLAKIPDDFTFDSAKKGHDLLRLVVTLATAIDVLAATPLSWHSLDYLIHTHNVLTDQLKRSREILRDQDYVNYISEAS